MNRGITIVEVAIVLSIIAVLGLLTGISYQGWVTRYRIEKITKELYADMMHARLMSMEKSLRYYAVLNDTSYAIFEDTDDDGKESDADSALPSFPRITGFILLKNTSGAIFFSQRGTINKSGTIRFSMPDDPDGMKATGADYDCMKVSTVRIVMGRYNGSECLPL